METSEILKEFLTVTSGNGVNPFSLISESDGHDFYKKGEKVLVINPERQKEDDEVGLTSTLTKEQREEECLQEKMFRSYFDQILDLQERMAKGMVMIKSEEAARNKFFTVYLDCKASFKDYMTKLETVLGLLAKGTLDRVTFVTFKDKLWEEANPVKDARNRAFEQYSSSKSKLNKLWDHWKRLAKECQLLAGESGDSKAMWREYFSLISVDYLEIYRSDPSDIDSRKALLDPDIYIQEMKQAHLNQELQMEEEVEVDYTYQDKVIEVRKSWEGKSVQEILDSLV